jgi:hypothetical protein
MGKDKLKLSSAIPFTKHFSVIHCLPTPRHCSKGRDSSASIGTLDVLAHGEGLKKTVEVWDQVERKMYTFNADDVVKALYFCGDSDYMAFKYKILVQKEST